MNTEQKAIEPFILPSQEMFTRVIAAPEEYPILVFQPSLSHKNLKRHRRISKNHRVNARSVL